MDKAKFFLPLCLVLGLFFTSPLLAQCPPETPLDCGDGYCCPSGTVCCPGMGFCCDTHHPICRSDGLCQLNTAWCGAGFLSKEEANMPFFGEAQPMKEAETIR